MRRVAVLLVVLLAVGNSFAFALASGDTVKVIYHIGDSVERSTVADSAKLTVTGDALSFSGKKPFEIKFASIHKAEWTTMPGGGHMIKLSYDQGPTIFMSVTRINWFGFFVIVNLRKTANLFDLISEKLSH